MTYRKKGLRYGWETVERAWESMSKDERAALDEAADAAALDDLEAVLGALDDYAVLRYRRSAKAARDAATDAGRRVLVGARLDREAAARVRRAAVASGRSVYRFVADAVAVEAQAVEESMRSTGGMGRPGKPGGK